MRFLGLERPRSSDRRQSPANLDRSFVGDLIGTSGYKREYGKRRRRVVDQYRQDRHRLYEKRKRAERELKKRLEKTEEKVLLKYGLDSLDPSGSEDVEKVRKNAQRLYEREEREAKRNHEKNILKEQRELRNSRDQQFKAISEELQEQRRQTLYSGGRGADKQLAA